MWLGSSKMLFVMADLERCLRGFMRVADPFIIILFINYSWLTFIIVRMDIKRNVAQQQSQAKTNLMTPLLNIAKASTPLRTRVLQNTHPNSTPITVNKIVGTIHKSPNNKENYQYNPHQYEGYFLLLARNRKQYTENNNRINLSPVLSLNRKLTQGPQNHSDKANTPDIKQ